MTKSADTAIYLDEYFERCWGGDRMNDNEVAELRQQVIRLEGQLASARRALAEIDSVAVSKKAGASKKMQAIARNALSSE